LSKFGFLPMGLFEPVICKDARWMIVRAAKTIGMIKCKAKNRVNVALLMENPPHNHSTIEGPTYGMADSKFVITVAPQNDIWPHGSTYPKKSSCY